jgi:hypothetical protein
VRLRHYTEDQRRWLGRRYAAGGKVFLLLWIEDEYLLFRDKKVLVVGTMAAADLRVAACRSWRGAIDGEELIEELTR